MSIIAVQTLQNTIVAGLKRRSMVTCSRWAENCRIMGKPFPGRYNFRYYPWTKEMHNTDTDWVGKKAAQLGYTEVALNRTFFTIDIKRLDCLYVLPAERPDAMQFAAGRFDPALQLSPYLHDLFSDVKNVHHKRAGATNLYIRGSRSRSGLKSIPVSLIVLDELDEMTQKNLPLASERQSGQVERQTIKISTPTVAGKGIDHLYQDTTQEHFYFRCPACSRFTELIFPDCLVIEGDNINDPRVKDSHIICKECKAYLPHETKHEWLALERGSCWQPMYTNRDTRGFYINQLYSPSETPALIANAVFRAKEDPADEQELFNSKMGLVHEVKDSRVSFEQIEACISDYNLRPTIQQGSIMTMGVDQGAKINYQIDQWYYQPQSSSMDLNENYRPRLVDAGTVDDWDDLDALMRKWCINYCVVDANPEKRNALAFASRFDGHVSLCHYAEGIVARNINKWAHEPSVSVDRTAWLDLSLGRIRKRHTWLPKNLQQDYKDHIHALIRKPEKDKFGNVIARYVKGDRVADHYAHARNYSELALQFAADTAGSSQSTYSPR